MPWARCACCRQWRRSSLGFALKECVSITYLFVAEKRGAVAGRQYAARIGDRRLLLSAAMSCMHVALWSYSGQTLALKRLPYKSGGVGRLMVHRGTMPAQLEGERVDAALEDGT